MSVADTLRLPAPFPLPATFDRHRPDAAQQRDLVLALGRRLPWAELAWPELVEGLLALGRTDIPLARLTEGHVDALRILRQAGADPHPGAYGVWASRSQATGLRGSCASGAWTLDGTLRFASGAGVLDRALVPVWLGADEHLLLDVPVADWTPDTGAWQTRAMELSRSHTYLLADRRVTAEVVGPLNFYLRRPGFFPGGIGVAAVWAGGAVRLLDLLDRAVAAPRRTPAQHARVGLARTDLAAAVAACRQAATALAHDGAARDDLQVVATLCRSVVGGAVRRVLDQVRAVAGAAGLAYDADLTRCVDDLALYGAQQNTDADADFLGRAP